MMNGSNPNLPPEGSGQSTEPQPETLSLLGGVADDADDTDFEDETAGPRMSGIDWKNSNLILFAAVALVAVGAIWLMRASQSDLSQSNASYDQIQSEIDRALSQLENSGLGAEDGLLQTGEFEGLFGETEGIVSTLVTDMTEKQVPLHQIQKNPFAVTIGEAPESSQLGGPSQEQLRQQRLEQLQQQVERMELQGVFSGGFAVIDQQMVREGDEIDGFTVRSIDVDRRSVELISPQLNQRFMLSMQNHR